MKSSARVLVTGSSGYLGAALVERLRRDGRFVVGLDPVQAPTTDVVGSVADRSTVRAILRDHGIQAVLSAGALHKPQVATHAASDFIDVNVTGTLNLLEESVAPGSPVERFVFTSTTSVMISRKIRDGRAGGAARAAWITEDLAPLEPRNIYGVTKLAAEHLCRMFHGSHGLPLLILRTSRFFPEEDDMAGSIAQGGENTKANELLFRRLSLEDVVESHVLALERAPELCFDTFIVSSKTPFAETDCEDLIRDAPSVVARLFPAYRSLYERRGWTMFDSIDRVYVTDKAERRLGFVAKSSFAALLDRMRDGLD